MINYVGVSGEELRYISGLTHIFDDLEVEEEEALDDETYERLRDLIINPDFERSSNSNGEK